MKWASHKVCTFAGVYAVSGGNLPLSLAIATFSHLPDIIEFGPGKLIFSKHRGASHSPILWLAVAALLWSFSYHPIIQQGVELFGGYGFASWWVLLPAMGALCHLIGDALSKSGIPIWNGTRLAGRLYRTGTASEYMVVGGVLIFFLAGFLVSVVWQ